MADQEQDLGSIYTIGHSNRTLEEFLKLLQHYEIGVLFDVRTVPRSRHVPHFNSDALRQALQEEGIEYRHHKGLGGLRKPVKDSLNLGWRNAGFRGFADYMQTSEFLTSLQSLIQAADNRKVAIMCAEAVPWRCHRSLIADALVIRNIEVRHIISEADPLAHELTPFALTQGERIVYPQAKATPSLFD
ncbi:MAG: DUF488 family protein [Candidatus Binatia bacterium]